MKKPQEEKVNSLIVGYENVSELTTYFSESNPDIYTSILNSIESAVDKKTNNTIPFAIKKKNGEVTCLLVLDKSKWKPTLEAIHVQFMAQEKYEFIRRVQTLLKKINENDANAMIDKSLKVKKWKGSEPSGSLSNQ